MSAYWALAEPHDVRYRCEIAPPYGSSARGLAPSGTTGEIINMPCGIAQLSQMTKVFVPDFESYGVAPGPTLGRNLYIRHH